MFPLLSIKFPMLLFICISFSSFLLMSQICLHFYFASLVKMKMHPKPVISGLTFLMLPDLIIVRSLLKMLEGGQDQNRSCKTVAVAMFCCAYDQASVQVYLNLLFWSLQSMIRMQHQVKQLTKFFPVCCSTQCQEQ